VSLSKGCVVVIGVGRPEFDGGFGMA